jgi:DNA repair exonuclease SbcCD ATPase subunit
LQKASLNQLLVDYRHNESVFQIEQNNKIMELQNELQELIEKRARLESEFNEVELRQSLQQAELAKLGVASIFREVVDRWEAELEKISDQIHDATTEVGRCDGVLGQLKKRRAKILALKGDCPTCEQPITQRHQQHALSAIDSEIATASEELIRCNQGVSDLSDTERATKLARDNEIAVSRSFVDEASTKLEEIKSRWSAFTQAVGAINWIDQALERRTQQIESARNEQSSWDRMILATEQKLAELAKVESVLKVKDRRCVFELDHLQFWREGFSNQGLKSFILNAVTPYMNQRASHYSQLLTGGEIDIKFNTQSTLKTGKVREQFAVEVVNRNGANTYAGNSGGERARTDLAINFVLSDLVAQRSHRSYPQRFFDEPFEGLDEAGVEAVMDLLADMVQEAGSVFVITHQPGMQSLFNRSIEVVKQNGRTTIKQ